MDVVDVKKSSDTAMANTPQLDIYANSNQNLQGL
jgi:hypothetical protein